MVAHNEKPNAVEQKADAVAGHKDVSPHEIVSQVNDDLRKMSLEQRQNFFHRLSDDSAQSPNHDLPGLYIEHDKQNNLTVRSKESGDILYSEQSQKHEILEGNGHGHFTTTKLDDHNRVTGSVDYEKNSGISHNPEATLDYRLTYRDASGHVTGSAIHQDFASGNSVEFGYDQSGRMNSLTRTDSDGLTHRSLIDEKGNSLSLNTDRDGDFKDGKKVLSDEESREIEEKLGLKRNGTGVPDVPGNFNGGKRVLSDEDSRKIEEELGIIENK